MVRVSVIITNFNYAAYVGKAIDSVLAQSHGDVECIVVDDGSTDASREVIARYKGKITAIEKKNGGQLAAAIDGVKVASGDVLIFLDADDFLYRDACEAVVAKFSHDVSLVQYRLDRVDPNGNSLGSYPAFPFATHGQREFVLKNGFLHTSPTSGNAFSRGYVQAILETLEPEDAGSNWIDGYIIFAAPFLGNVIVIDRPLGAYLVHGFNVSLAGGRTRRSANNSVVSALWQRKGYWRVLRKYDADLDVETCARRSLAPSHYRYALILRRGYDQHKDLLEPLTESELALRAVRGFWRFPGMSLRAKVINIVSVCGAFMAPPELCRRAVPEARGA